MSEIEDLHQRLHDKMRRLTDDVMDRLRGEDLYAAIELKRRLERMLPDLARIEGLFKHMDRIDHQLSFSEPPTERHDGHGP